MSNDERAPGLDGVWSRHPYLLKVVNIGLLLFITITLLTMTDAPVVLYQAF